MPPLSSNGPVGSRWLRWVLMALLGSDGVQSCTESKSSLEHDAIWMQNLAISQLVTLPLFMLWRHFARFSETQKSERDSSDSQRYRDIESQNVKSLQDKLREDAIKIEQMEKQLRE